MKNLCIALALLAVFAGAALAAETPETILIRKALSSDLSGHRRADIDLVLSAYTEHLATYQGHGSADPRAWSVLHPDRAAFARHLAEDLKQNRYDTERTVTAIQVRGDKATATTVDSGQVVSRADGQARPLRVQRFWTFSKVEDDWLATAVVEDLGDSLLPPAAPAASAEIAAVLEREARAWKEGDASGIAALFAPQFMGYDAYGTYHPTSWKIVFSDAEELETWLAKRLNYTAYDIERQVIHARVGESGGEALALTREKVKTTHKKGSVVDETERHVFWTLSRRDGSWKITNMLYDLGLPE